MKGEVVIWKCKKITHYSDTVLFLNSLIGNY